MIKRELILALRKVVKYLNVFNKEHVYILKTGYMAVTTGRSIYIVEFPSFKTYEESFAFDKAEAKKILAHFETRLSGGPVLEFEKHGMTAEIKGESASCNITLTHPEWPVELMENTVKRVVDIGTNSECKKTDMFSTDGIDLSSLLRILLEGSGKNRLWLNTYEKDDKPYMMVGVPYKTDFTSERIALMAVILEQDNE